VSDSTANCFAAPRDVLLLTVSWSALICNIDLTLAIRPPDLGLQIFFSTCFRPVRILSLFLAVTMMIGMKEEQVRSEVAADVEPVHLRHHNVQQDKSAVDLWQWLAPRH
jgi:hypothetical protein